MPERAERSVRDAMVEHRDTKRKPASHVLGWSLAGAGVVLALVAWVLQEKPSGQGSAPSATVNTNQAPAGPQSTGDASAPLTPGPAPGGATPITGQPSVPNTGAP